MNTDKKEVSNINKYKCIECDRLLFEAEKVENLTIHCRKCKHVNTFK